MVGLILAAASFLAATTAIAGATEPEGMRVISSDSTARYVALGVDKAIVIDVAGDIKDVLVGNPKIVTAVVRTKHRAFIIGTSDGQTNVYFYDIQGRQIGALDVSVSTDPRPLDVLGQPVAVSNVITVYRGSGGIYSTSCTPRCIPPPEKPEAAPTQIIETRAR